MNQSTDLSPSRGQSLDSPERLEALAATGLFDSPASEQYDRLTRLASSFLAAPTALMSLVDDRRQFFKSAVGLEEPWMTRRGTPLTYSFCQHVVTGGEPLRISNAPEDPRVRDSLAVTEIGVVSYLGVPIRTPEGHNLGSFCVIDTKPREWTDQEVQILRDLTFSLQTELNLKAALVEARGATAQAIAANRAKSDFLAHMSHELRTPLNSVIGFANVLLRNRDGNLADRDTQYLDRIKRSGVHLLGLINNLLDLAKIESGKTTLDIADVPLADLTAETLGQFEVVAAAKGVALVAEVPADCGSLRTDRGKLQQVLTNLVGNAMKFTEKGSVTVSVICEEGTPLRLTVRDTGIGIPADRLGAVFNPFEQAAEWTSARYGGTGLGLPISQSICGLLGYRLGVSSVLSEGTTFTIDFGEAPSAREIRLQ